MVKNRNTQNIMHKSKVLLKIKILNVNHNVDHESIVFKTDIEILVTNRYFDQDSKFRSKDSIIVPFLGF